MKYIPIYLAALFLIIIILIYLSKNLKNKHKFYLSIVFRIIFVIAGLFCFFIYSYILVIGILFFIFYYILDIKYKDHGR